MRRWETERIGPQLLFVSPGLHDCYHEPEEYEHHAKELAKLAGHLASLQHQTVVWIDANPFTYGANGAATLQCIFHVNAAAHQLVREHNILMFSRQTMIVSGHQVTVPAGCQSRFDAEVDKASNPHFQASQLLSKREDALSQ